MFRVKVMDESRMRRWEFSFILAIAVTGASLMAFDEFDGAIFALGVYCGLTVAALARWYVLKSSPDAAPGDGP